ncbi:DNA-binding FadR family transcriptional regulator [Anoxybacillus vitaminiphilus]|uniref:DNA-binding FadR family transcriptional regulator n=1 Tax=Paranoxybacillus vitaminiphilus TaxID=581036 RepID=A0A327YLN8_9BACL|nr:GntR family transcriptional regulator [Anoxybacillus vitaminiphilus]RAK21257.1 DNA-binding FadR family transcriptional regulator [Anoxybacillus vitaminiphilus]
MASKVYIEILEQLRRLIEEDGLVAGDKIPSERELSERLNVGRSSVREALRALELLGIIETRRGEGTYIKEFGEHQLVSLLGTFILQGEKAKADLIETKLLIEKICLQLACQRCNESELAALKQMIEQKKIDYETFFKWVTNAGQNYLLMRIWLALNDFFKLEKTAVDMPHLFYENMFAALESRNETALFMLFEEHVVKQLSKR